jgi:hypothetical protein
VDDVNFFFDLIPENFHGDKVVDFWVIGRVDQNTGRLVNRDKPFVLV